MDEEDIMDILKGISDDEVDLMDKDYYTGVVDGIEEEIDDIEVPQSFEEAQDMLNTRDEDDDEMEIEVK